MVLFVRVLAPIEGLDGAGFGGRGVTMGTVGKQYWGVYTKEATGLMLSTGCKNNRY
jgi:hypothetical protein